MKACPLCKNSYEDWVEFCFQDGMPLVESSSPKRAPPPKMPTLESAPSLPPEIGGEGGHVPDFDAFDAPEPTLIRMAKLQAAQKAAGPAQAPRPAAPTSAFDVPEPARAEDLPAARALPAPPPVLTAADEVPSATEEVLRSEPSEAAEPAVRTPPPVVRRPVEPAPAPEPAPPAEEPPAAAPAAVDEFEFPRPDEDSRATVPMPTPQAPRREKEKDRDMGVAPAAAGLGVMMMGAIGVGVVILLGGGYFWWSSQKKAPAEVATVPAAPAPAPKPAPPPEPTPPPEPPPEPAPVEAVEPPPEVPPAPAAPVTPTAPAAPTRPTAATPAAPASAAKPTAPAAPTKPAATPTAPAPGSPWTTPSTPPAPAPAGTVSDNPWGAEATVSTGKLTITSDPPGAAVTVDDKARGAAPVTLDLTYGRHKVKVAAPGYRAETSEVNLSVQSMSVPFRLQAETVTGLVSVFGPTGGTAFVDGRDMGPLPVSATLEEGVHTFKLVQVDGKSCQTSRDVRFAAGGRPMQVNLPACE